MRKIKIPWNKGKTNVYSKETLEKMSKVKIGKKPSKKAKRNMSKAQIGRHHSDETKKKMSISMTGILRSDEAKKNMSKAKSGKNNPFYGKHMLEKSKKKISLANRGRKINSGKNHPLYGKHHSIETRKKMSKSNIGRNSGEKNHNWKGGISTENDKIRNCIEYRLWREAVFARDNWICQKSNIKGGKLNAHHIKNFSKYPELRLAIDNGITFSKKEHKKFHKKYGIKNNNEEQIKEFLNN